MSEKDNLDNKNLKSVKMNSEDGMIATEKAQVFTSECILNKRRIAETSRISHRELVASGKKESQNKLMIELISKHQPMTVREAWRLSGFEQNSANRCISELTKLGKLKIAFNEHSRETGRLVGYYTLIDWEPQSEQLHAA